MACVGRQGGTRQVIRVSFEYRVFFTRGVFDPANPVLAECCGGQRCLMVLDDSLAPLAEAAAAYPVDHASLPEIIPGGEGAKQDPALIERLQRRVWELGLDRHAALVAVGGGAVLDAVGFVAATAHRGLRLVRVPSTVLGQADSGVGVKNGVNAFGVKNFLGTFAPPDAVINDLALLDSLGERDRRAGMAEAVKVALIRDAGFFAWLEEHAADLAVFRPAAVEHLVRRCAELHLAHICGGGDPFERGSARPLDFGHWAAHKLEMLSGNALRHGEAVALGIALDSRYSALVGLLPAGAERRIAALLRRLGFALAHPLLSHPALLDGLREFREHLGGELTVTLLQDIGRGVEVHAIDAEAMCAAASWLESEGGQ